MELIKLAKQIHAGNIKKGFWDKKGNEGQRLMLVISELSEMLEADRKGKICRNEYFIHIKKLLASENKILYFEDYIKDTTGDELADAFIRMLDYCVGFKIKISQARVGSYTEVNKMYKVKNLGEELLKLSGIISRIYMGQAEEDVVSKDTKEMLSDYVISRIMWIAKESNINLEKHVEHKMWYNTTRPKKHNKKY